ncbi:DUF5712 family protein [Tunicatimonas pelagia]|uniref:DUF5712 family protein n=1 Tax=Tunicatimonas pelagia TaxID=931531 RepID=UPI002666641C|nr:DUF5712 family protein [Tunicatimonas pelagia]WKN46470.1 DUF5712 family protein [Tunicatimonas pelagia]
MHIKIINPSRDGRKVYDNTGSVVMLVEYLQHESKEEESEDTDIFFNQQNDKISAKEVRDAINGNTKGVRTDQEKFLSIVVSPSENELAHIQNDDAALRKYVRQVMNNYAETFRLKDGKKLSSNDLVWYATIHEDRDVKNIDLNNLSFLSKAEQVRVGQLHDSEDQNDRKEIERIFQRAVKRELGKLDQTVFSVGDKKPGLNKHVHIIVSRRDRDQRYMLNPRTKKARFHIRGFQERSARHFQSMFGYSRDTIEPGFYKERSERDHSYFREKIAKAVEHINLHTGNEKIDPQRLQDIGEKCNYSRAFFVNLTKLKYRFAQGDFTHDPYFYAERGRDQKASEYFRTLDQQYLSDKNIGYQTKFLSSSQLGTTSGAKKLLSKIGGVSTGPGLIKETLLLDEERKRLKKYHERGQGSDRTELS